MHDVVLAFLPHFSGILGGLFAAQGGVILERDHFGLDEALFKIRVDFTGGFGRLGSDAHRPGPRFFRPPP